MENEAGEIQSKFAEIVWANAPLSSGRLVEICKNELNWKKSTTYTVLRRMCEIGLIRFCGRHIFYFAETLSLRATKK